MSVINLDDYRNYPPTNSCYLDGRYFNMVFKDYPGLIKEPLVISIAETPSGVKTGASMVSSPVNPSYMGVLRVIIETPTSRHSNVILIEYQKGEGWWFEPFQHRFHSHVKKQLEEYLGMFLNLKLVEITALVPDVRTPGCDKSGFCTAYSIRYAYDSLRGNVFDPSDIRSFAAAIEKKLGPLPLRGADVEYGWLDDPRNRNLLIGALGGAAIGGLVTQGSPVGFLGGAAIGGLGGYLLTQR